MARSRRRDSLPTAGLDIGTSKTCLIAGDLGEEGLICRSLASLPSAGIRKGVVTDADACGEVVGKVIEIARTESGLDFANVFISVPGSKIEVTETTGSVAIRGAKVTREETERAIESAAALPLPEDREILHVAPCDFVLDGTSEIRDPVGMAGAVLDAKALVLTGAISPVRDIIACAEKAGLRVTDIILQSLAAAESSLTEKEKMAGIALADIGGGTTDVSVFQGGWLRHAYSIAVGGFHLTNDLAIGLGISFDAAQGIKESRGTVLSSGAEAFGARLSREAGGGPDSYTAAQITGILRPRAEELIDLIDAQIACVNRAGMPVTGLVLTGGSALLTGMDRLAESMLGIPVRIGQPNALGAFSLNGTGRPVSVRLPGEAASPAFAAAVGLLLRSAFESAELMQALSRPPFYRRIVSALSRLFTKPGGRQRRREEV